MVVLQRWALACWGCVVCGAAAPVMAQAPSDAAAVSAAICQRAADKLERLVPEWRDFVVEFKAEARNPSVLALAEEHRQGHLKARFRRHCLREWGTHEAIFVCFSGSVTPLGLALCMQKDTNPHGWEYQP